MPIGGFSIALNFANPQAFAEGEDPKAVVHPGMKPLMARMKQVLSEQQIDFAEVIQAALARMAADIKVDADAFTRALNLARTASGMPILVSAEADIEEAVTEAVRLTRQQLADGEEQRFAERLRITREAEGAEVAHEAGDPPPPRGARRRPA